MKVLERLELVDRISRELQSRMSYGEIDTYLKAHGVDTKKTTTGVNSKWVYSKELLGDEPEATILRIADELNVPHSHVVTEPGRSLEAAFWEPFHFKLFVSHLSSFKVTTAHLQSALRKFGISAFVAHVDIEPTREWQGEIEAGLHSMDALLAILMPGFKESNWTDQEVGVAVGRGVLIIPVMRGLNPYGFISKYQGLNANGKNVSVVADEIFQILVKSPRTRARMLSCLTETTLQSKAQAEALFKLRKLASIKDLPAGHLQKLKESASASSVLMAGQSLEQLNAMLVARGAEPVATKKPHSTPFDDDIPF
jgi:hypothetical protein